MQITLRNIANEEDEFMLFEPIVDASFIYSYCATTHSSQGASVKESMTIHEWNLPFVSREWLWTSITRCVDFLEKLDFSRTMTLISKWLKYENEIF